MDCTAIRAKFTTSRVTRYSGCHLAGGCRFGPGTGSCRRHLRQLQGIWPWAPRPSWLPFHALKMTDASNPNLTPPREPRGQRWLKGDGLSRDQLQAKLISMHLICLPRVTAYDTPAFHPCPNQRHSRRAALSHARAPPCGPSLLTSYPGRHHLRWQGEVLGH